MMPDRPSTLQDALKLRSRCDLNDGLLSWLDQEEGSSVEERRGEKALGVWWFIMLAILMAVLLAAIVVLLDLVFRDR